MNRQYRSHLCVFSLFIVATLTLVSAVSVAGDRDGVGSYKFKVYGDDSGDINPNEKPSGVAGLSGGRQSHVDKGHMDMPQVTNRSELAMFRYIVLVRWLSIYRR